MTTTVRRQSHHEPVGVAYGVTIFAGILLTIVGSCQILLGLSAVLREGNFSTGTQELYQVGVGTWGWANMLLGAIGLAVGIGILRGQSWAASAGIGFAVVSVLGEFAFLLHRPLRDDPHHRLGHPGDLGACQAHRPGLTSAPAAVLTMQARAT